MFILPQKDEEAASVFKNYTFKENSPTLLVGL